MVRRSGQLLLAMVACLSVASIHTAAQSVLTHHVREATRTGNATVMGRLPADQVMQLDVVLPLRDTAGLKAFLADIYNRKSPSYHHYLTPAEFAEKFGPTQEDYDNVVQFVQANGFAVVGGKREGMEVQIKGPVSSVERAFHVNMNTYQHPSESRLFYAPDREPSTTLPFALWHVSGLDNYSIPKAAYSRKADYAMAHGISVEKMKPGAGTGAGPGDAFLGSDFRAAYYGGSALTGAGQNLGLYENGGYDMVDVDAYYTNSGQTLNVPLTLLSVDGTSTSCEYTSADNNCDDGEEVLDLTTIAGMAPGASSVTAFIGSTDTAILAAMTTNNPLPNVISCSWGWWPVDVTTDDPYFLQMQAQGQSFFMVAGDTNNWGPSDYYNWWPADDGNVVTVGGTDLVTNGPGGPWKSETAWNMSGGGVSPNGVAIPSYQQIPGVINSSNKGSTTLRNGPDVAGNANYDNYLCANQQRPCWTDSGGTSFATPMWAGYVALMNEQLANQGQPPIGFINPLIYPENISGGALTPTYTSTFHDITSGSSGSYSAVTGFDLVTGWGSPNGAGLINTLAPASTTPSFSLSGTPASVMQGGSGASTVTTSISGGFDSIVGLAASGQPAGVTVGFAPASIAAPGSGTSSGSVAVASTVATGSYPITVTGSGGGMTYSANFTLTVMPAPIPSFKLSATSASVVQGGSGTSTVTETVSGGFNSAIALSASGQPSGVTLTINPASTAASGFGTSSIAIAVASSVAAGSYPITVTGIGQGITNTASFTLTVTAAPIPAFALTATSASVVQGGSGTSTVKATVSGGFNSAIALSASGAPSGVTLTFNPASTTAPGSGTSSIAIAVASTVATGTYPITVTGIGQGITNSASFTLTVTAPVSSGYSLSVSPATIEVNDGSSESAVVSVAVTGGYSTPVTLSASGIPRGVSVTFSTVTIDGAGKSRFTFTAAKTATAGNFTITITGASGGTSHSTTLALSVESRESRFR